MIGPTLITDLQWKGYLIFMFMNLAFLPVRFVLSHTTYTYAYHHLLGWLGHTYMPQPPGNIPSHFISQPTANHS